MAEPVAPAGADEIYRWTDESGKVHFGNRPPSGKVHDVGTTDGAAINQGGGAAAVQDAAPAKKDEDRAARLKRLQKQNKQASKKKSGAPVLLTGMKPDDPAKAEAKKEAECQRTYGKSCAEIANWREKAVEDCKRINSAHCDDPGWIDAKRPKTIDEKNALREQNDRAYKARMNSQARSRGEPPIY